MYYKSLCVQLCDPFCFPTLVIVEGQTERQSCCPVVLSKELKDESNWGNQYRAIEFKIVLLPIFAQIFFFQLSLLQERSLSQWNYLINIGPAAEYQASNYLNFSELHKKVFPAGDDQTKLASL